jgi:hypothetical protein
MSIPLLVVVSSVPNNRKPADARLIIAEERNTKRVVAGAESTSCMAAMNYPKAVFGLSLTHYSTKSSAEAY